MLYWCHRYENTSKEFQEHIFDNNSSIRPLPADPGHESDWQNQENHQKVAKNAIFQKSIFFYMVAGNMIFGRKLALWGPESTQKPYIDHPTQYGDIWQKVKKIGFLTPKIVIKIFSKSIFFADEARPPNQYWGSIHHIGAPKAPLSCCIGHTPSYRNLALKIPKKSKKTPFFAKVLFLLLLLRFGCW